MEERQITVDGTTYRLDEPFLVLATQNPIESYGTFPLPEAQTDRFFMRLSLGYMTREQELSVIGRRSTISIIDELKQVVTPEQTKTLKEQARSIHVCDDVKGYMMNLIAATRENERFLVGVSTRGAIALYRASQVLAAFRGRDWVLPEDVSYVAPFVLAHRLTAGGAVSHSDKEAFIKKIIINTPVPLEVK